jgi:hypothetical protein
MLQIKRQCKFVKLLDCHTCINTSIHSNALLEKDREMQRALMEHVLEVLLEVEALTSSERTWVQDGLALIQSDVTEMSTRLTKLEPYLETFTDLSSLISVRYAHQSKEEVNSVCIAWAWAWSLGHQGNEDNPHHNSEQEGNHVHPHRPSADALCDSQRRHLANEINKIINVSTAVSTGESMGLNRRVRWSMDKLASGSTLSAGGAVAAIGNTANAQLAARQTAQVVSASRMPIYYNHDFN